MLYGLSTSLILLALNHVIIDDVLYGLAVMILTFIAGYLTVNSLLKQSNKPNVFFYAGGTAMVIYVVMAFTEILTTKWFPILIICSLLGGLTANVKAHRRVL